MLPSLPDELDAAVETARTEIARAIQVSGLKNDPLVHLMQAVSASLEAQHRLHRASTGHLREVSGRLDQQVAEATTTAESAMAAIADFGVRAEAVRTLKKYAVDDIASNPKASFVSNCQRASL